MAKLIHIHKGTVYAQRNGVLIPVNTDGLVGYWPMTQGSGGTAYDESKTGNDGTINGATWTSTANGKALDFDGTDDYVNIPYDTTLDYENTGTIIAWVKLDSTSSLHPGIYSQVSNDGGSSGVYLSIDTSEQKFRLHFSSGSTCFSTTIYSLGVWYHVAGVWDGSNMHTYVNGNLENSATQNGPNNNTYDRLIGCRLNDEYLDGKIDEVRIYDRALSAQEITNIYEKTRGLLGI